MSVVIFTDLDGTILNDKYSFNSAKPALRVIKNKKIPLIFCTSKTELETKGYAKKMGVNHPFVVENGGAIFIPKRYFKFKFPYSKKKGNYLVIELGADYKKLVKILGKIKKQVKSGIVGFSNMSAKLISQDTGLTLSEAKLAKKRDYSLPFKIVGKYNKKIVKLIKKYSMNYTRSRDYHYIMGPNNKGKAVRILIGLYKRKYKDLVTLGLGDSYNDLPMLKIVDKPFLIKNTKGFNKDLAKVKNISRINLTASKGWNKAILDFVKNDN